VETNAEAERQHHRALGERLATEAAARERAEAQYELEVSAFRSERSGLMMKFDALGHRAATSDQILAQVRQQLREKDEAHRANERMLKEAVLARAAAERRLENYQADMERQSERFLELQRAKDDLASRCDMLAKAIAAKDAANEIAANRNAALSDRIEQLIAKHEATRAELELSNRRLAEDLENEKSERTLLQGALEIARESRAALQKQHDALKRSGRGMRHADGSAGEEAGREGTSNVHAFTPSKGQ
jgi:crescentin